MLLALVLPSALVPATMAFSLCIPKSRKEEEGKDRGSCLGFSSTSVSAGRDSPDGDREKRGLSGLPEAARGTEHP